MEERERLPFDDCDLVTLVILLSLSLYSSLQYVLCNHALTAVESYDGATNFLLLMSVSLMT